MLVTPVDTKRFEFVHQDWAPRTDDVFIASFPKSGTTWTQQVVRLIYSRGLILDSDPSLHAIIPWLDDSEDLPDLSVVDSMTSPRVFKSHNPYHLLPRKLTESNRLIYVTRGAKDTAVSMYFHTFGFKMYEYDEAIEHFIGEFMAGRVEYGPYWSHLASWYAQREHRNILVLHYEEMQVDLAATVSRVASFLDQPQFSISAFQLGLRDQISINCPNKVSSTSPINEIVRVSLRNLDEWIRIGFHPPEGPSDLGKHKGLRFVNF